MSKKMNNKNQSSKTKFIMLMAMGFVLLAALLIYKGLSGEDEDSVAAKELVIPKSEVSETAKFYPYEVGNTYMEVIAVKAKDGTIRTALNTCQICYDSGRGYYEQQGDELICFNCGNRFRIEDLEQIRGGCNPIPVLKEYKQEDEENIIISQEFLAENADYFKKWKK
ncbi:MAG: DUF2318 domain-containing protein [Clostridiaceae bacterium]|nr:DUF2318 domain-containing protein [Clostridiaceae bacterium]